MSESDPGAGEPARPLPLDGVVVLDLGQIYQGPYAGLLLAYSGARVIKVEHPRGEALRGHSHQLPFAMLNSSKEIVSLDLKSPRGRELFIQLAGGADAVLCNFAPGVPERLGIDAETLWQTNPKLVFAQASGYGLDGPDAERTAMDVTVQAHMGVMSINGFADRPPVKSGATFIDFLSGTHLYGADVTALFEAQRTGRGRLVSTSMAEAAYYTLTTSLQAWQMHGVTGRMGNRNAAMSVSPSNVNPCSDGHIALIAAMNSHWRSVLEVIGRADLLGDERLRSNAGRCEHMDEVDELVTAWTSGRTRAEAAAALSAAGVPVAEIREVTDVVHDDHMIERGFLQWTELDGLGEIPLAHSPLRWHGSDMREVEPYRPVGADNEAIYREFCGLEADELAALAADRII